MEIKIVVLDMHGPILTGKENGWEWFRDRKIELVVTVESTPARLGLPGATISKHIQPELIHLLAAKIGPEQVLFVSDQEINVRRARDTWGFNVVAVHPATGATYHWQEPINSDKVANHVNFLNHQKPR